MAKKKFSRQSDHRAEEGQAMVEYALILGLVTVVSMAALTLVGANVAALLDALAAKLGAVVPV